MKRVKRQMSVLLDMGSKWDSWRVNRIAPYRLAFVGLSGNEIHKSADLDVEHVSLKIIEEHYKSIKSYSCPHSNIECDYLVVVFEKRFLHNRTRRKLTMTYSWSHWSQVSTLHAKAARSWTLKPPQTLKEHKSKVKGQYMKSVTTPLCCLWYFLRLLHAKIRLKKAASNMASHLWRSRWWPW